MELGDYISIYRKEAGLTIDELALRSRVPKGTINKIIAGTTKSPTLETVQNIASALGKTISDFTEPTVIMKKSPSYSEGALKLADAYDNDLDYHGKRMVQLVVEEEQTRMKDEASKAARTVPEKIVRFRVPEYSHPMSAGTGVEADLEFPNDLELVKAPPRGTSYVAHVTGNSMEPDFHDGDMVFVHAVEEIPVGRIGVFLMNGQQWVKELGHGVLISHNRDYDPIAITDGTRCQGLVIGLCDSSYFEA